MKQLYVIPFLCAVPCLFGVFLDPPASNYYYRYLSIAVALAAAINSYVTAAQFAPSDYLFRSWVALGSGYSIDVIRGLGKVYSFATTGNARSNSLWMHALLIAENLLGPLALFLFVRAWKATGLAAPGSRRAHYTAMTAGIGIAVLLGAFSVLEQASGPGAQIDIIHVISTLGDVLSIAMVVPLIMPALALRGGLLMATWASLAIGASSWLVADVWWAIDPLKRYPTTSTMVDAIIPVIAIMFFFGAATAQREGSARILPSLSVAHGTTDRVSVTRSRMSPDMRDQKQKIRHEHSSGGAVVALRNGSIQVVLIATRGRTRWGLPKGAVSEGESSEQAALREVQEETGLEARIIKPLDTIEYYFRAGDSLIRKRVDFYLMSYVGGQLTPQLSEVDDVEWVELGEAIQRASFDSERKLLEQAWQAIDAVPANQLSQ